MKGRLPGSIKREIEAHLEGMRVRYIEDRFEASASSPGSTMDIVCAWVAADHDHIAWVVGTKVERIMILSRKTGRSRTWEVGGDADEGGADLYTFSYVQGSLIMAYFGDHNFYIASVHDLGVVLHSIPGDSARVLKECIVVRGYGPASPVRVFSMPLLNEVERLTEAEAGARDIMPMSLGLEYHRGHNAYPIGHVGQVME